MLIQRRHSAVIAAMLVLSACQPLPHPFETDHRAPTNQLLALPEVVGITVDPVAGVPQPTSGILRDALTKALQDADIPAGTAPGNTHSYHVSGTTNAAVAADGSVAATIDWTITAADGSEIARDQQRFTINTATWRNGGDALAPIMDAEADRLAQALHLPIAAPTPASPPPPPTVRAVIAAAVGAPGDGDQSLPRALAYVLQAGGVTVLDQPDGVAPVVSAKVTLKELSGGQQDVKIVWTVANAKGKSIGTVAQENTVPDGTFNGAWSDAAAAIAQAAGESVRGLIDQSMQSRHSTE